MILASSWETSKVADDDPNSNFTRAPLIAIPRRLNLRNRLIPFGAAFGERGFRFPNQNLLVKRRIPNYSFAIAADSGRGDCLFNLALFF